MRVRSQFILFPLFTLIHTFTFYPFLSFVPFASFVDWSIFLPTLVPTIIPAATDGPIIPAAIDRPIIPAAIDGPIIPAAIDRPIIPPISSITDLQTMVEAAAPDAVIEPVICVWSRGVRILAWCEKEQTGS